MFGVVLYSYYLIKLCNIAPFSHQTRAQVVGEGVGCSPVDPHPYPQGTRTHYLCGYAIPMPLPSFGKCWDILKRTHMKNY